jgi:hypothetical protein
LLLVVQVVLLEMEELVVLVEQTLLVVLELLLEQEELVVWLLQEV